MTSHRSATTTATITGRADTAGLVVTHVGGPTAILEMAGLRLLTDPTFDPPGRHPVGDRELVKLTGPAIEVGQLGPIDVVLVSHDQHPDNLDARGLALLASMPLVLSTPAAAERVPGVRGLAPWERFVVPTPAAGPLTITAVPARHGPPGFEEISGPVTGFVLAGAAGSGLPTVYVSGDNASVALVEQIAARFTVDVAVLFCGAARRPGRPQPLTLTADDAVQAAHALPHARIVPVHADGWMHFTEGPGTVAQAFAMAGLAERLILPGAGVPVALP